MPRAFQAGLIYFAYVFGAGFVMGTIRQLWAVPRFGVLASELVEEAIMLCVIYASARYLVRKFGVPAALPSRIMMGLTALVFLVSVELTVVLSLQGLTFSEYVAQREPISGIVYLVMLGVFAAMPSLLGRRA